MLENIKDPLFTNVGETNTSKEIDHTNMEEICVEVSIDIILEDSLSRISLLTNGNTKSNITSLHKMAKKGPTPASNNTFESNFITNNIYNRSNVVVQLLPNIPKYNFHFLNLAKYK